MDKMITVSEKDYNTLQNALNLANAAFTSIKKSLHKEENTPKVSTSGAHKGPDLNKLRERSLKRFQTK